MQQKLLFCESRHEHVSSQSTSLAACQRVIFKIYFFVFHFFDGTLLPYLSSHLSVYTPSHTLQSNSYGRTTTLSCTRWKLKGFGYQPFPVQARGLEQPSCSHPRLQFSLTVQNFSWNLLPTLRYSNPLTGIWSCAWISCYCSCCCCLTGWEWKRVGGGVGGDWEM